MVSICGFVGMEVVLRLELDSVAVSFQCLTTMNGLWYFLSLSVLL